MRLKKQVKKCRGGMLLSVALAFLLAVYGPLELYLGSQGDFWFDLSAVLPRVLALFALMTLGGWLAFFLLRLWGRLPYRLGLAAGVTALLGCYIQGTFLAGKLPPLDGTAVDWGADPLQRIASVAVFAAVAAAALLLALKAKRLFPKMVAWGSVGLTAMLGLTLATLLLTTPLTDKSRYLQPTDRNMLEYSADTNLIVLVVDALDSKAFGEALAANPEFSHTFDDFTYFNDALAAYPFTRNSMPMIFTGEWYENKGNFDDYVNDAFQRSPLLAKLTADQYKIGLYNEGEIHLEETLYEGVFENQMKVRASFTSWRASFKLLAKMTAIRYAPWDLKSFGYDAAEYGAAIRLLSDTGYGAVQKQNSAFYQSLLEEPLAVAEEKCARLIHIEGAHVPYQYDKEMNIIENGSYTQNIEACLTICHTYLQKLKESGVYDNSVIVILGDHGYDESGEHLEARMNPAVLIKGLGQQGEAMAVDQTPISYEQLAGAFADLLGGASAAEVFPEDAYPEGRRMLLYWYLHENAMDEYYARGRAYEIDRFELTDPNYDQ